MQIFRILTGNVALAMAIGGLMAVSTTHAVASAAGNQFSAKIYDRGVRAEPIFLYQHETKTEGSKQQIKNVFTTPDGKEVAIEQAEVENGKLKFYQQTQKQIGGDGRVDVEGDKLKFSYSKDGKAKTATETLKENFVVGPTLVPYLQAHWDEITQGKEIDVRFAVIDRRETVGFTFKKVGDADYKGKPAIIVKMKPTSLLISALVDPLHFTFASDGSRLLELDGRVIPKREVGGKYKDLDAISVYEYP